ncbi:putative tRNA pseudouridine synthase Pus10 [Dissophora globulifera]|nr:putative tRNA pseudouridine synthase Pus10 [Dissophora globulifera]
MAMKHESSPSLLESDPKRTRLDSASSRDQDLKARLTSVLCGKDKLQSVIKNPSSVDALFQIPCCGRCMLKTLGVQDLVAYELPSKEIKQILLDLCIGSKPTPETCSTLADIEPICVACVGAVQFAEDYIAGIMARISAEAFVATTFNLTVTLPTSTLVRNHAAVVYMRKQLPEFQSALVELKDVFKQLICGPIERQTGMTMNASSEFTIQVSLRHEETADDHVFLSKMPESGLVIKSKRENRKNVMVGAGRPHIIKALSSVSDDRFSALGKVPPSGLLTRPELESVEFSRESVYMGGRYLKFSRDVSQTPWTAGTQVLAELSVSGIICPAIKDAHRADDFKFVTAGREDANVRMLGDGRPFYIELINPREPTLSSEAIRQLGLHINTILPEKVQVRSLTAINAEDTKVIKEGEETKTKSYSALCWTSKPVDQAMIEAVNAYADKPFFVEQQTPIRVLQRRAQMIRKKQIHSLKAFPLEGHFLVVHLHTEAGTYIKEFVHSDLGRNQPSLASIIGCETDIMELDVLTVDLDFPPRR